MQINQSTEIACRDRYLKHETLTHPNLVLKLIFQIQHLAYLATQHFMNLPMRALLLLKFVFQSYVVQQSEKVDVCQR